MPYPAAGSGFSRSGGNPFPSAFSFGAKSAASEPPLSHRPVVPPAGCRVQVVILSAGRRPESKDPPFVSRRFSCRPAARLRCKASAIERPENHQVPRLMRTLPHPFPAFPFAGRVWPRGMKGGETPVQRAAHDASVFALRAYGRRAPAFAMGRRLRRAQRAVDPTRYRNIAGKLQGAVRQSFTMETFSCVTGCFARRQGERQGVRRREETALTTLNDLPIGKTATVAAVGGEDRFDSIFWTWASSRWST